ncbi:MAG: alpha/beta hydrolase [Lachnospiraceae bacterium]|nr:alpha/beta hydrolase [Lachnospiraceae bacterium]
MLYNAKSGEIKTADAEMEYVAFGRGKRQLILIPGLGDGLRTVRGMEIPLAFMYRQYAKDYRVYVLSRRKKVPEGFQTRDMAADIKDAMDEIGISKAFIVGVSQGGMIAQYLAIDFPEYVEKLVLAVTLARPNETICNAIAAWKDMAESGDYKGIMRDTAEKSYTAKYVKNSKLMFQIFGNLGKPKSFERFLRMADACVTHDAYEELSGITCPTLVIGGKQDRIATGEASEEVAGRIRGCQLHMFDDFGHGVYEETPDFWKCITDFLEEDL